MHQMLLSSSIKMFQSRRTFTNLAEAKKCKHNQIEIAKSEVLFSDNIFMRPIFCCYFFVLDHNLLLLSCHLCCKIFHELGPSRNNIRRWWCPTNKNDSIIVLIKFLQKWKHCNVRLWFLKLFILWTSPNRYLSFKWNQFCNWASMHLNNTCYVGLDYSAFHFMNMSNL